ncbi:hypothetical protein F5876DRAFT_68976 [Lentinula aff. lateritia]|uniref:Uncharacterized protein n=1 Tax=Lentinula aff. lateritia TaxID=2804960 RepID=A0ACC1TNV3_9AGAR|nr:hypothetical protein F5876DRAFT_68976 [Lentinula aff. lateritia]
MIKKGTGKQSMEAGDPDDGDNGSDGEDDDEDKEERTPCKWCQLKKIPCLQQEGKRSTKREIASPGPSELLKKRRRVVDSDKEEVEGERDKREEEEEEGEPAPKKARSEKGKERAVKVMTENKYIIIMNDTPMITTFQAVLVVLRRRVLI